MEVHTIEKHFGRLWEAAIKSLKLHLKKVLGEAKLNFEEFTNILFQVEACLNSHQITPDLFQEHRITELPDENDHRVVEALRSWRMCQNLVRHIRTQWSQENLNILSRFSMWHTIKRDYKLVI